MTPGSHSVMVGIRPESIERILARIGSASATETRWGDASHHVGLVDWAGWFAGNKADVGIAKCIEGMAYTDPQYANSRARVRAAGKVFGAYDYIAPTASNAVAEAKRLLSVAGLRSTELAVCDAESFPSSWHQADAHDWLAAYGDTLMANHAGATILYGSRDYVASGTFKALAGHFHYLWVPRYTGVTRWPATVDPGLTGNQSGFTEVDAWQWTDNVGGLDATVSRLTIAELTSPASPGLDLTMSEFTEIMAALADIPALTMGQPIPSLRPETLGDKIAVRDYLAAIDLHTNVVAGAVADLTPDAIATAVASKLPGGAVDVGLLAKAIADELAARLSS